ncbi:MAG: hypothetical protein ACYCQI_14210 [Gammaproteobacteria bacterium]
MGWWFENEHEARRKKQAELKAKLEDTTIDMQQKYGAAIKDIKRKNKPAIFSRSANPDQSEKGCFARLFCCFDAGDDEQPEVKQVGHREYQKI